MYQLVDDVLQYPNFLPWCSEAVVHYRDDQQVKATVTIAKGPVNKSFTTQNIMTKPQSIEMQLVDGPFKRLHGFWRFDALDAHSCKVSLDLDFEFSNMLVSMAIGSVFNQVANTLVDSFVERARAIYGKA
jgi:ribosome-associated toxin RatA of RatAB toxin-antitoxin module